MPMTLPNWTSVASLVQIVDEGREALLRLRDVEPAGRTIDQDRGFVAR